MSYLIDKIEKCFNSFIARRFQKAYKKALIEVNEKYASEGIYQVFENTSSISTWISDESNMVSKMIQHGSPWGAESATEQAFKYYTGSWSEKINLLLRNPFENHLSDCEIEASSDYIKLMDDELSTRQLHTNIIVVRWLRYSHFYRCFGVPFHQVRTGQVYTDNAFLSTSLYLKYIGGYDDTKRDLSQSIMLIIEVPKGATCIYPNQSITNRYEYELLLSRGQSLIIKDILYHFQTTGIVICEMQ